MNRGYRLYSAFMVLLLVIPTKAQNFEEIYSSFRQQAKEEYRNFRNQCNEEYADFMEKAWRQFKGMPPKESPLRDNPVVPPMPYEEEGTIEDNKLPAVDVLPVIPPEPQPKPIGPIKEQPQPVEESFTFYFYGTKGSVRLSQDLLFTVNGISEANIADTWRFFSAEESLDNVIRDCLELRIRHGLCDWAYFQMLQQLGKQFYGKDCNEAVLLTAYLYCQSGYKMRLAHDTERLYILLASKHAIYDYGYFVVGDESFYLLQEHTGDALYICEASFPNEQGLSLWMEKAPSLNVVRSESRTLQSQRYPELKAEVYTNLNLLSYFDGYPSSEIAGNKMTCWAMYAMTPISNEVKASLYPTLESKLEGLSEADAANRLLNFVQTAFEYEYDEVVWGGERALFAEESLHYPYCDCEDRSILYSHLVRDLLGLKVALVYYPGHLATAVCFNEEVQGDYLSIDNHRFIICDPTYINAPIGANMPGLECDKIEVIVLE